MRKEVANRLKNVNKVPRIGEVYMMQFIGAGSEQDGKRPALVIQNNVGNTYSPNVIVVPLTSKIKKSEQPTHVFVPAKETGLERNSIVLCENPVSVSKERLGEYITTLPDKYMSKVAEASILATSVIAFLDPTVIMAVREKATKLNSMALSNKC